MNSAQSISVREGDVTGMPLWVVTSSGWSDGTRWISMPGIAPASRGSSARPGMDTWTGSRSSPPRESPMPPVGAETGKSPRWALQPLHGSWRRPKSLHRQWSRRCRRRPFNPEHRFDPPLAAPAHAAALSAELRRGAGRDRPRTQEGVLGVELAEHHGALPPGHQPEVRGVQRAAGIGLALDDVIDGRLHARAIGQALGRRGLRLPAELEPGFLEQLLRPGVLADAAPEAPSMVVEQPPAVLERQARRLLGVGGGCPDASEVDPAAQCRDVLGTVEDDSAERLPQHAPDPAELRGIEAEGEFWRA